MILAASRASEPILFTGQSFPQIGSRSPDRRIGVGFSSIPLHLALTVRIDIQISRLPPMLPDRLEAKTRVRPSTDRPGCWSAAAVFSGSPGFRGGDQGSWIDRKSTRLNSSHRTISYAVFCLKKKKI